MSGQGRVLVGSWSVPLSEKNRYAYTSLIQVRQAVVFVYLPNGAFSQRCQLDAMDGEGNWAIKHDSLFRLESRNRLEINPGWYELDLPVLHLLLRCSDGAAQYVF